MQRMLGTLRMLRPGTISRVIPHSSAFFNNANNAVLPICPGTPPRRRCIRCRKQRSPYSREASTLCKAQVRWIPHCHYSREGRHTLQSAGQLDSALPISPGKPLRIMEGPCFIQQANRRGRPRRDIRSSPCAAPCSAGIRRPRRRCRSCRHRACICRGRTWAKGWA